MTDQTSTPAAGRMAGRVVLVTGGASGIGLATARLMAREGARGVVIAGRREAEGQAAADACTAAGRSGTERGRALFVRTDVTREDEVAALVARTVAEFGRLDVAFNNAGVQERRAPLETQDSTTYDRIFDGNVRSVFLCLKHQIPVMERQGGGAIVVNASVSGVRNPNPGFSIYNASKAAVLSMVRSAALETAGRGIRINAVAPGRVVTDMMMAAGVGDTATIGAGLPLKRMGRPEEVAEAVLWLASDAASYVVGHVLATDGGFLAS